MKTRKTILTVVAMVFSISLVLAQQTPQNPNSTTSKPASTNACVSGNCNDGWGKKNFDYGYYEGFWKNGKRDGYGLFDWSDSGKYIGAWKAGKMTGYGVYLGVEKDMVGEYQDGFIQGLGYIVEDGEWEQGRYDYSQLEDAYTFYDNEVTTGCTAGDCQNKYGRYKWSNGDQFTGFWKNGSMFMGTYTFASGDKYTGQFNSSGQFHGMGRFFFENGDYYGGDWKNGKYHGRGYYSEKATFDKKIGEWSNGNFIKSL